MNIVLLQSRLHLEEIDQLLKEFPQYLFLSVNDAAYQKIDERQWSHVEILYGNKLSPEDFSRAPSLRWLHVPSSQTNRICLSEIEERGSVIVTDTPEENLEQVGEFVIGGILTFAKNFIQWSDVDRFPSLIWDSKWRDKMWTLKGKTLLQIGLGLVGNEITRRAKEFGMQIWGVDEIKNFHPHCQRTYTFKNLHSLLPAADIVSIALPGGRKYDGFFGADEISLMKQDSILSLIGSHAILDIAALLEHEQKGKSRGVLIDAPYATPIPLTSPVWKLRRKIITPDAATRPKAKDRQAFKIFLYNLRRFAQGNFRDLKNKI